MIFALIALLEIQFYYTVQRQPSEKPPAIFKEKLQTIKALEAHLELIICK